MRGLPRSMRGKLTLLFGVFISLMTVSGGLLLNRLAAREPTHLPTVLWIVPPAIVVLTSFACWNLIGAALRPMTNLTREAARLSVHEPTRRLGTPDRDDELAELTRQLNLLLARTSDALYSERSFVDDASHELRTPLAILRGELDLALMSLADGNLDDVRASVTAAADEARRLTRLAEDLLVLARLDHGELTMRNRAVVTFSLIENVVARLGAIAPRVTVNGDHNLISGDPDRLEQVFTNLIANARRFARGQVRIEIFDEYAAGQRVVIADDGPGFPANMLPGAFDRFRRADRARGRGSSGSTGLGLAIASAIVSAHGGTISADNGGELGGAIVSVHLPLEALRTRK